jgi:hypothetical protein
MTNLSQLLAAARSLAPEVEIRLRGTAEPSHWVCVITVGPVVIFESKPGNAEVVIEEAARKLMGMSQKMRAFLLPGPAKDGDPSA